MRTGSVRPFARLPATKQLRADIKLDLSPTCRDFRHLHNHLITPDLRGFLRG
jgi:hypothetical protein